MSTLFPGLAGGAMSGAGIGMSVGGPVGAGVGAIVGGIAGALSGQNADKKRMAAKRATDAIPMTDPEEAAHLARVRRLEQHQAAGTDASSAYATRGVRNALGQTQANILRAGGGNAAANMQGLLSAQNSANNAVQGIGAAAGQRAAQTLGYEGGLIGNMAERRLRLGEFRRNQAIAESVNADQNVNNLLSAGLGLLPQMELSRRPQFASMTPRSNSPFSAWRNAPPTAVPMPQVDNYAMVPGSVQEPTSAWEPGQQLTL